MRTYEDCELCGASRCKHGLCSNTGDPWTDGCPNARGEDGYQCSSCGEAAHEQFLSDYYGGDSVFCESQADQMSRLRREKEGILP